MEAVAEATPLQLSVQWRRSRSALRRAASNVVTGLLTLPLASLEALWLAPAPAQQAGLSKRAALSRRSFDQQNASLAVAMVWGIKATLLCAHSPTVLINPDWALWIFSLPSCNDTDYIIRKMNCLKNIKFFLLHNNNTVINRTLYYTHPGVTHMCEAAVHTWMH